MVVFAQIRVNQETSGNIGQKETSDAAVLQTSTFNDAYEASVVIKIRPFQKSLSCQNQRSYFGDPYENI